MTKAPWRNAFDFQDELMAEIDTNDSEFIYYDALGRISADLVNYRISNGLSQTDLATMLGVSQAMISKYESGDYNISLKAMVQLYCRLKLPLKHVFEAAEDKTDEIVGNANYQDFLPSNSDTPAHGFEPIDDIA